MKRRKEQGRDFVEENHILFLKNLVGS